MSTIDPPQPDSEAGPEAHVPGGSDYVSDRRFADFPVSPDVLKAREDLLGTTSPRHVAVLLTHTDDRGLDNVVVRLRRRLADAAGRLKISDLKLGQAALSAECRTADALLSRAVSESEPIVVH